MNGFAQTIWNVSVKDWGWKQTKTKNTHLIKQDSKFFYPHISSVLFMCRWNEIVVKAYYSLFEQKVLGEETFVMQPVWML